MLGMLCWQERGAVRMQREQIAGLNVGCVYVSKGGMWGKRRFARADRLLRRYGVRRLLPVRDSEAGWSGLPEVDPLPLYRAMAAGLVLRRMETRRIRPERATVVLRGDCPDMDLAAAARKLCPAVRQVRVETCRGAQALQNSLYRQFGAAVDPIGDSQDTIFVRFSGKPEGEELCFCPGEKTLAGLELDVPELLLPPRLMRPAAICAMWQAGLMDLGRVQVQQLPERKNILDIR